MLGMYFGFGAGDALTQWADQHQLPITLAHEFGDSRYWSYFETGTNFGSWAGWVAARAGRRFSYSCPLLPGLDDPDLTHPQKYAKLAAGDYDSHFTLLGQTFAGYPALHDTFVRLGWEFNGAAWPWSVPPDDQTTLNNYKTGFNRAAAALKAACPTLQIEWCPNCQLDYTDRTFADMYPGNTWIDVIGIGAYDYYWPGGAPGWPGTPQTPDDLWRFIRDGARGHNGLRDQVALARANGKQLAHTEWGVWDLDTAFAFGGGDNPHFIDRIADWHEQHRYLYQVYNNFNPGDSRHFLDDFPETKNRYLLRHRNPMNP